jgi:hypothetical protein
MKSLFVEDIFVAFANLVSLGQIRMQPHDRSAVYNFTQDIHSGKQFTEKQGAFIVKILYKYRNQAKEKLDYEEALNNPAWKQPFRVIDKSKKVWVESDELNKPWILLKFPFDLKDDYEIEFANFQRGMHKWDADRKLRKISLFDCNFLQVDQWVKKHKFEIDNTYEYVSSIIEETFDNADQFKKYSYIDKNNVVLKNAPDDAIDYFEKNKTGVVEKDLLLAKSMSYSYEGNPTSIAEKISSLDNNQFWIKSLEEFLEFAMETDYKICFILDRASDDIEWLNKLVHILDKMQIEKSLFRVCFRKDNKDSPDFNKWVSKNNFGGKISTAKFLIFNHKPAKWLFKDNNDVIIYASNGLYPSTDSITGALLAHSPFVFYVGDFKPTMKEHIVEL